MPERNKKDRINKEEVFQFLKDYNKKFTVRQLYLSLKRQYPQKIVTYINILKWIEVLRAEHRIQYEDYEVVKIVWWENEK